MSVNLTKDLLNFSMMTPPCHTVVSGTGKRHKHAEITHYAAATHTLTKDWRSVFAEKASKLLPFDCAGLGILLCLGR